MSDLRSALGRAYELDQLDHNRPAAIAHVRGALGDQTEARGVLSAMASTVAARTQGADCGCHVTKVQHDILSAALAAPNAGEA
jgi:hypothetical protein